MTRQHVVPPAPVDLGPTLGLLVNSRSDPTTRIAADGFWRTTRNIEGTATVHLAPAGGGFDVEVWGDGAEVALAQVPEWLGAADTEPLVTDHPLIAELNRRFPRVRICRTADVMPALYAAICGQKVTATEATRAFTLIVKTYGEPAPGPADLMVAPEATLLAEVPYYDLHVMGVEKKRADIIRRAASASRRLVEIVDLPIAEAHARLQSIAGIGPWTSNEVTVQALGDTDAVSVGDFHLKNHIAFALGGKDRGTDEEMIELLEPFRPHRARVIRLLGMAGITAPRRGPRMAPRDIQRH